MKRKKEQEETEKLEVRSGRKGGRARSGVRIISRGRRRRGEKRRKRWRGGEGKRGGVRVGGRGG